MVVQRQYIIYSSAALAAQACNIDNTAHQISPCRCEGQTRKTRCASASCASLKAEEGAPLPGRAASAAVIREAAEAPR